jgi:hypothetical protein
MKINQLKIEHENTTEYESNVFVFSKHLHPHGKGQKPTFTFDQYPDEYIHEQIENGPISGSFLIEHSSKATVGWINIKGRPYSVAKQFRVSVSQISKGELEDEYWHQNESWIITIMLLIVLVVLFLILYHFVREKKAAAGAPAAAANSSEGEEQALL